MKFNIFSHAAFLIVGVVFGFFLSEEFSAWRPQKEIAPINNYDKQWRQFQQREQAWSAHLEVILKESEHLRDSLKETERNLQQIRHQNRGLRSKVELFSKEYPVLVDTAQKLSLCDSAWLVIDSLLESETIKDSLVDEMQVQYDTLLFLKDSTISMQKSQYDSLRITYIGCLEHRDQILSQNVQMQQQLRKYQRGRKWLSAAVAVAAGGFIISNSR